MEAGGEGGEAVRPRRKLQLNIPPRRVRRLHYDIEAPHDDRNEDSEGQNMTADVDAKILNICDGEDLYKREDEAEDVPMLELNLAHQVKVHREDSDDDDDLLMVGDEGDEEPGESEEEDVREAEDDMEADGAVGTEDEDEGDHLPLLPLHF